VERSEKADAFSLPSLSVCSVVFRYSTLMFAAILFWVPLVWSLSYWKLLWTRPYLTHFF